MRRLGAIIAGGRATRFGGDKGAALLSGKALIDHVADGLRPQCDALIVCGREWPGIAMVDDRPTPDMGPLGGLNAALYAAQQSGFDVVFSAGCDVLPVPLFPAPDGAAYIDGHYLFSMWPVALAGMLDQHLATQSNHSMRHWIEVSGARPIACDTLFHNLNTRDDLKRFGGGYGL